MPKLKKIKCDILSNFQIMCENHENYANIYFKTKYVSFESCLRNCNIIHKAIISAYCSFHFYWHINCIISSLAKIYVNLRNFEQLSKVLNPTYTHCLKITQNVAFEFMNFGIFHQFVSY